MVLREDWLHNQGSQLHRRMRHCGTFHAGQHSSPVNSGRLHQIRQLTFSTPSSPRLPPVAANPFPGRDPSGRKKKASRWRRRLGGWACPGGARPNGRAANRQEGQAGFRGSVVAAALFPEAHQPGGASVVNVPGRDASSIVSVGQRAGADRQSHPPPLWGVASVGMRSPDRRAASNQSRSGGGV